MAKQVSIESPGTEPLSYTGKVSAKGTGKPIPGATVVVRRSVFPPAQENRILQETKHETNANGNYSFTIPPEQVADPALYIELDVEHPDYAPRKNFGYALAMIRKNESLGDRPFFENVELYDGETITGRVQTPDGQPAKGMKIVAYSQPLMDHLPEIGSFASTKTDESGAFRFVIIKGGLAILWLLPEQFALSTQPVKRRGDLGRFVLQPGISVRGKVLDTEGKPIAGIWVNAQREGPEINDDIFRRMPIANPLRRSALTNGQGEFEMAPLPPGNYQVQPSEHSDDSSRDKHSRQPLPNVFVSQRIILREGEMPEPLKIRAVPHVIIEARYVDSEGMARNGHPCFLVGQIEGRPHITTVFPDTTGEIVIKAPRGLENAELHLHTNEHSALRCQIGKEGRMSHLMRVCLGTLENDIREIRIIRYVAPILLVNARDQSGQQVEGFQVQAIYVKEEAPIVHNSQFINGAQGDVFFQKQEDGRWRSAGLLPDEEITVTVQADGYKPCAETFQLSESEQRELEIVLESQSRSMN